MSFFKSPNSMDISEAKKIIQSAHAHEYNLIDVRQSNEFARSHIPGAKLIPLSELQSRMGEIDPDKPTVVY